MSLLARSFQDFSLKSEVSTINRLLEVLENVGQKDRVNIEKAKINFPFCAHDNFEKTL